MGQKDTPAAAPHIRFAKPELWYRTVRGVIYVLLRLLTRLEVRGLEYIPDRGPYIILTNHLHWLDPPAIMATFPFRAYLFAAEKWEVHPVFGPLFRSLDAIFVQRGEVDRKALRQALYVLRQGGVLGVAPEGTRSRTGGLQQGRSGAAYMAYRTGARLLPVATWGQEGFLDALRRLRRVRMRIVYGPPFDPPPVEGKASTADVKALSEEIMYHLAAMLPPQYRGVYSDVAEKRPDLLARYAASGQGKRNEEE